MCIKSPTYVIKAAFTLPHLLTDKGMMALCSFLSAVVLVLAINSVQAAVRGDSTSVRLSTCLPSTSVYAANSFLLVLLCKAFRVFSHLGLPPTPSPIAFRLSQAQTPVLSVQSNFRNSLAFPPQCINSHLDSMPRERQRLISRRGGAWGRAAAQHFSEDASAYPAT